MTRFFIPSSQIHADSVTLLGDDRHHLLHVLRKEVGAEITVLNGKGQEYRVRITQITPEAVLGTIIQSVAARTEPRVQITLAQSLPKADKFEWIIQKNTEIGVARFLPVQTERSAVRLDAATAAKKADRWRKIIREAAEQSGRQIVPELMPVAGWREVFARLPQGLVLIPWEGEKDCSLRGVLNEHRDGDANISVLIGPEGGFSLAEVDWARDHGARAVTLGPRILRAETAGLVVSAAILYHYGDLE